MANPLQLRFRIHAKQPLFALRQGKLPPQKRPCHRLQVSVPQPPVRLKLSQLFSHTPTLEETRFAGKPDPNARLAVSFPAAIKQVAEYC
jgi:hypothetical protein